MEKFNTIKVFNESSLKERNSLFTAQVFPIETEGEAKKILDNVKKKYYDASHHCYAFKLINQKLKYSDDGEPSGTAGIRILNAIDHFQLSNILLIVIRYFGGTKLGVGALGKTYYNASIKVLQGSKITTKEAYKKILIISDFNTTNSVHNAIEKFRGKIINAEYSTEVRFDCMVKANAADQLNEYLKEISKGKIRTKIRTGIFY